MSFNTRLQQLKTSLESSAENDDSLLSRLQTLAWISSILGSSSSNPVNPNSFGIVTLSSDYFVDSTDFVYKKLLLVDAVVYAAQGPAAAIFVVNAATDGQFYEPVLPERLYSPADISGIHLEELAVDTNWTSPTNLLPNVRKVNVAAGSAPLEYTRYFSMDSFGVFEPPPSDAVFFTLPPDSFAELEVRDSAQELWFRVATPRSINIEIIRRGLPITGLPTP
jgi:hypothetical protein